MPVIEEPSLVTVLSAMGRHGLMVIDTSHNMPVLKGTANYYSVLAQWNDRPPLLALDAEHRERGWIALGKMGISPDAWYVAVHAREPGFSVQDESAHAHRNSDIRKLFPAIAEIRRRGGWVIRMGDPTMQPLPTLEGVVDYAVHPSKSDWMDVFLCAEARFFVGNTSGIYLLATAFGTPCALANVIPSSHIAFSPADVSILKLIWSSRENRYLTFDEIFNRPVAEYRYADHFTKDGLRVDENTEEELYELVVEMLDRSEGCYTLTPDDDALHRRFFSLFRPGHFGYGAASRICSKFLRRHRDLLRS
ncbi:MAG: TIGR04372 family glycosyltransferase [Betaproteobacteria bacterium]